jgi:eukaryotic-like serine/threonine-protein kinase
MAGAYCVAVSSELLHAAKALAVLPFRFRGPVDGDYVADALLEELTDLLSMTRGLKVSGSGATARLTASGDRDPRMLGAALGVDVVVDGTIQLAGTRLRISARLVDVHTGFQIWNERFEGPLEDVFDLQDRLGKRIAEALRLELELLEHRAIADTEALESYLRARQAKLRWRMHGDDGAVHHYRQVLARAPDFRPAIAGYALAVMRAWFLPQDDKDPEVDWAGEAERAVEQAMAQAPQFTNSQIAAASWSMQASDFRAAAEHLREALRIAPTCALAHEYLGRLLLEAGHTDKGLRHVELALELDDHLYWCLADLARHRLFTGDMDGCREHLDRLLRATEGRDSTLFLMYMRMGAWTRDLDLIRQAIAQLDRCATDGSVATLRHYGVVLLEPYDASALAQFHAEGLTRAKNGRLRTFIYQLAAEQTAFHGDRERTLAHLQSATDLALADLAWLDYCPLFDDLRDDPQLVELRARVLVRCDQIVGG